jgi:hypothetical protein
MESNAFNSWGGRADRGELGFAAGAVGLLAVVVTFALDPLGAPVVVLSWALVLGGLTLAIVPSRLRAVGKGLVFAGAALPLAAFLFLWVAVSFGVLNGSVTWW